MSFRRYFPLSCSLVISAFLAACVSTSGVQFAGWSAADQERLNSLLPADILLLGEQHDAPEHHELERRVIEWLASRHALAAVAIEKAPRGRDTRGLPRGASESDVKRALAWNDTGWPWDTYGPVIMAAVRADIPVLGANLPRAQQRPAMQDASLDDRLTPQALNEQIQRIRAGHCDLLPESQLKPMSRIQVARDLSMAQTVTDALQPGRSVLLIAGNGHVERHLGVPIHLPRGQQVKILSARSGPPAADASAAGADVIWTTPPTPPKDYCAEMRRPKSSQGSSAPSPSPQPK